MNSKLLILDEDSTATNFMICDEQIKGIVKNHKITPYNERIRSLYDNLHVSSILVIGSCVNYLDVADNIFLIEDFKLQKYQHQISINKKSNINWLKKRFIKKQVNTLFINELVNEQLEVINKDVVKINNAYINIASISENMLIIRLIP